MEILKFKFQGCSRASVKHSAGDFETTTLCKSFLKNSFPITNTTPIFQVKFPLNEERKSLGTDELGCPAKYLISHLVLQDKIDSLSSNINIYEKWYNVSFGKKVWGKCSMQQFQFRLFGLLYTGWCRCAP